jgi:hypothetical protein
MIVDNAAVADIGGLLGSPIWTVLATLLAAAAIWVSIWLYRRQRNEEGPVLRSQNDFARQHSQRGRRLDQSAL